MNTIDFTTGLEIAKSFIQNMVNPVVDVQEYSFIITDGHYTVLMEDIFGDFILRENTVLGEVSAKLGRGTVAEVLEFQKLHELVYQMA